MPITLIGNVNVSALNVPQALVQIVPPQFLFNGVATNVCGFVGTASWGPVDLGQSFGSYSQGAAIFGPTINRNNDIGGHVQLAVAQGAGYFAGVRVTDGTDAAASNVIGAVGAAQATDTLTFATNPASGTITVNGTVWTFVGSVTSGNQILIGGTLAQSIVNAAATLNAAVDANTSEATYVATSGTVLTMTSKVYGTAGNAYTLAQATSPTSTVGGATFSGGSAGTTGVTITGKYTGTLGNSVKVIFQRGSAQASYKIIVSAPSLPTEIYDSVASNLTGNAVWLAIASALNNGISTTRPYSNIVVATAGSATAAPILNVASTLTGGTDGVATITTSVLLGQDSATTVDGNQVARTGMYALRGMGVAQFTLCDMSDLTAASTLIAFGTDIGAYAVMTTQASDTIANAVNELDTYGISSFVLKVMFGDWILWIDSVNGIPSRMTSPAAVTVGKLGNSSPQINLLNKPLQGFWGTQSTALGRVYGYADFQSLALSGMDIICLDKTLTNNFIHRLGVNTSSNPITFGDEYTRVIFFLAKSIQLVANPYVGANMTASEMLQAKVALQQFLALAQTNGIIYTINSLPSGGSSTPSTTVNAAANTQAYQVVMDNSNNTQATAALGYQFAYVKAIIGPIVRYFIINLEGGSSVLISSTPPGQ